MLRILFYLWPFAGDPVPALLVALVARASGGALERRGVACWSQPEAGRRGCCGEAFHSAGQSRAITLRHVWSGFARSLDRDACATSGPM